MSQVPDKIYFSNNYGIVLYYEDEQRYQIFNEIKEELECCPSDAHEFIPSAPIEELLSAIWLYTNWRSVTKHLTLKQKELFADFLDKLDIEEKDSSQIIKVDRWWKDLP